MKIRSLVDKVETQYSGKTDKGRYHNGGVPERYPVRAKERVKEEAERRSSTWREGLQGAKQGKMGEKA